MDAGERVLVKVRGSQLDLQGEESVIEMKAEGRYYLRSGLHYVLYEDDSLQEGAAGTAATVLKFNEREATLLRHGAVEQTLRFRPQQESRCLYRTVLGALELSVRTARLTADFGSAGGTLDIAYDLSLNGQPQSHNTLHVEVARLPQETSTEGEKIWKSRIS